MLVTHSTLIIDNISIDNSLDCNGDNDGGLTANVSGGQPPYTYSWTGGFTDSSITGLISGSYNLTVTDFDGCIAVDNLNLGQPSGILLLPNVLGNVSCFGGIDGSAEVQPIGGTIPYNYAWDNGETDSPATMLAAGPHTVTVTDTNGCTETTSVTITEPSSFTSTTTLIGDISCFGSNDGSSAVIPAGGSLPYTYLWDNAETEVISDRSFGRTSHSNSN